MIESLEARVRRYHDEEKPGDGQGGTLAIRELREVLPGVVAVRDNTGEIDIFVDTALNSPRSDPPGPYDLFAGRVGEAWKDYADMDQKYGMVCVVEDRWHPFFARRRASFEAAKEAAMAFLKPWIGAKASS